MVSGGAHSWVSAQSGVQHTRVACMSLACSSFCLTAEAREADNRGVFALLLTSFNASASPAR